MICDDCGEEGVVGCDDGALRCRDCAAEANYCWSCGRAGAVFDDDLSDEWEGACRVCLNDWLDTQATERYHSHLWDVGR